MPYTISPAIKHRIEDLRKSNNAYTFHALQHFLDKKFNEIEVAAQDYYLEPEEIEQLQHDVISLLENMEFMRAYALKQIKTYNNHDFNIDPVSLEKYIYKSDKRLVDMNELAYQQSKNSGNTRQDHLVKLIMVKSIVNKYTKENKKSLLDDFNTEIDKLYEFFRNQPQKKIRTEIENSLLALLDKLQTNENKYYDGLRFFSQSRKSNSTLQPAINEAKVAAAVEVDVVKPRM